VLMFTVFAVYEMIYATRHNIVRMPRASLKDILKAFVEALPALGFPVIILGGIYTGVFSPTEASAVGCLYAIVLEGIFYRSIKLSDLPSICFHTAKVSAATSILTAGGKAFSWAITYAKIPHQITNALLGDDPSKLQVMLAISVIFIIACCFVDSFPVIIIVIPIFAPIAEAIGIDMVHLGVVVTMQSAIGCITPPFGCTLFTAAAAFEKKFTTIVKGLPVYLILTLLVTILLTAVPSLCLFPLQMMG